MRTEDVDLLVAGGGPVGLTLAWQAARRGLNAIVVEKDEDIADQLRASTFHPPTLDMLEADGITGELIGQGGITPSWQIRVHDTGERAEFDLGVLKGETAHPYRLQCRQAVLARACAERFRKRAGRIFFSTSLTGFQQHEDRVICRIGGPDGHEREIAARWLAGCDGARSVVRETLGIGFQGDAYPEHTILATTDFPFEEHLPDLSGVNYIWGEGTTFSLLRLPGLWRCSFHPRADQTPEDALADEAIHAHMARVVPSAGRAPIFEKRIYRVHRRVAAAYRSGRAFLAGDAAHLNSPKGGMGMNGGVHDAFELAALLERASKGATDDLDLYERRRRPVAVEDIIDQADKNRSRMAVTDEEERKRRLRELQAIASDPERSIPFLRRSSMIEGLRKAALVQ